MPAFTPRPHGSPSRSRELDRALFGVLSPLVGEPGVTDVFVNPAGEVWVGNPARPIRRAADSDTIGMADDWERYAERCAETRVA